MKQVGRAAGSSWQAGEHLCSLLNASQSAFHVRHSSNGMARCLLTHEKSGIEVPVVPTGVIAPLCINNVAHILVGVASGFCLRAPSAACPCAALTWAILDLTRKEGYTKGLLCFLFSG